MSNEKIIRAWKDEEYLAGLGGAERAGLPAHPAGAIDLSEADLEEVSGGATWHWLSLGCGPCSSVVWGCDPRESMQVYACY